MAVGLIIYAYRNTKDTVDIEFRIHINEELIRETTYGEPPTFAIWIEHPVDHSSKTIFVTNRAGLGDWEGKAEVPSALPMWFNTFQLDKGLNSNDNTSEPSITGATPQPGYFVTRARVEANSSWICWIEVNLSGDYNDFYPEFEYSRSYEDLYGTGQPALLYKVEVNGVIGNSYAPDPVGMSIHSISEIIQPINGITTAQDIFDEIDINIVRPQPKIF